MKNDMRRYENVSIDSLVPYENNARTHSSEQLKKIKASIQEFGFINPILIDGKYNVIAGHGRIEAAKLEGYTELPCLFVEDLSDAQKRAYIIADNRLALDAEWDFEKLSKELEELNDMDFNLDVLGFDDEELESITNFTDMADIKEDDFQFNESLNGQSKSKRGQIYKLGENRLMCGDSTVPEDVAKLMDGYQADLVVTDPPYNVDYGSKAEAINKYGYHFSDRHIENDFMPEAQFIQFLDDAFKNMSATMKPGASFYIWHASITVHEFETALRINSLKTRQQLIWVKNSLVLGRQDYQWKHEPCLYGWKEGAGHYFIDDRKQTTVVEDKEFDLNSLDKSDLIKMLEDIYNERTTVIRESRPNRSAEHPTMKPIALLARLVKNSSKSGDVVLDLFGGSGSTMMSCEQLNRRCFMMELDEQFVDVIIERWEKLTGGKAELIDETL